MVLKEYSVWAATPTSFTAQTAKQDAKSPHIYLEFSDGSESGEAAINVKSTDKDTRLVYWVNNNFSHPITAKLTALGAGDHSLTSSDSEDTALDYIRTSPALLDINNGTILEADDSGNNSVLGKLEPILNTAISDKATIYIFGQSYHDSDGKSGIHDIHMNQGNTGSFENDTYSDGGFLVQFSDHWEAVFLAFASQEVPTDDSTGDPTSDAKALDTILGSGSSTSTSNTTSGFSYADAVKET